MYIILGGTGHVGSAAASALLERGQPVTIVTRDAERGQALAKPGARVAVADISDPDAVRAVFRTGRRAFLLNPPAAPTTDTDQVERATVRCILEALAGSDLESVVAQSTYGAQPGERIGDLNTLHDLEAGLESQPIPFTILRAAYYFSNWDAMLQPVRDTGVLPSMFPADLKLPMVAPEDLGRVAADLLADPRPRGTVTYVEGPDRYSAQDVARAFASAIGRHVEVAVTPPDGLEKAYRDIGFSDAAAHSYARMTTITARGDYEQPKDATTGRVELRDYIAALARSSLHPGGAARCETHDHLG